MQSPSLQAPPLLTPALRLRRWAYRLAAVLSGLYAVYVIGLKLAQRVTGGPLGEVGEFLLVLAAVSAFAIGLFADEASRPAGDTPRHAGPADTPPAPPLLPPGSP